MKALKLPLKLAPRLENNTGKAEYEYVNKF